MVYNIAELDLSVWRGKEGAEDNQSDRPGTAHTEHTISGRSGVAGRAADGVTCSGQCHDCALKPGGAAYREPQNRLHAILGVMGGIPFWCHDSLGWTPGEEGYRRDPHPALSLLTNRKVIAAASADPSVLDPQVRAVQRSMRTCATWKASVARLRELGWFGNARLTYVRRHFARAAIRDLELFLSSDPYAAVMAGRDREVVAGDIEEAIYWFANEAREARIDVGWLWR